MDDRNWIGKTVTVTIDRPLGSTHPKHADIIYELNYGYIEGVIAPDGEELDAYIYGVNEAVKMFTGTVIAIVHRYDDVENKLVVAPDGINADEYEIYEAVKFQEQYFNVDVIK
jgi:Inorganic pyrophosphatase